MKLPGLFARWFEAILSPPADPAVDEALAAQRARAPVLWLLGSAGAGKSSIVQRLTGDSRATIGNGFEPCTRGASLYEHPTERPVMCFLDTRGLGEADYDPREDLAACRGRSHAILLVMRIDDADQGAVLDALGVLGRDLADEPLLLVHTALHTVPDASERERVMAYQRGRIETLLGVTPPAVAIDFTDPGDGFDDPDHGLGALCDAIVALVPRLADMLQRTAAADREQTIFLAHRSEVLGWASAAALADVLPGVGLVAVPGMQGKMLHGLAQRYGVPWERRQAAEFVTALGAGFVYRYLVSLAGRQLGKFVPVYGQSIGAAAAASVSFASTYALGRAACLYLYRRRNREPVDSEALQEAFHEAFEARRRNRPGETGDS